MHGLAPSTAPSTHARAGPAGRRQPPSPPLAACASRHGLAPPIIPLRVQANSVGCPPPLPWPPWPLRQAPLATSSLPLVACASVHKLALSIAPLSSPPLQHLHVQASSTDCPPLHTESGKRMKWPEMEPQGSRAIEAIPSIVIARFRFPL
ncbi:hypothetical protein BHM03_00024731 [Ensete ventricosum]|nr:hypothetical protein BHM03_00024731 [Ensete ventricosum]